MNRIFAVCITACWMIVAGASSQAGEIYTSLFSDKAVSGYDAVSFFSEGGPVKGSKDHSFVHKGSTWLFSSQANLEAFKAAPEKYEPQYGGHCAWAAAQNYTAPGDPAYWKIIDGKLYLNYSADVQKDWEQDIPGFIGKANLNWPELKKK